MEKARENKRPSHYVQIDLWRCNGCVLCMRTCPTRAIRVREGKARIEGVCIDCGECIRICPNGAIKAITSGERALYRKRRSILTVSPVLYGQFGADVMPNDILLALREVFKFVYDQAQINELFNIATDIYIQERREKEGQVWPLISPICPVVNRLIAHRFPALLKHIIPLIPARELAAWELRRRLGSENAVDKEELGIYHVSPCSAKMISIKEPLFIEKSNLDGAFGINEVFDLVKKHLGKTKRRDMLHHSSAVGMWWALSGGEIAGLGTGRHLAISGIPETIRYLEMIEMGLLQNIEYLEFRACSEGCVGGALTVVDKYEAKFTLPRLMKKLGTEKRVRYKQAKAAYDKGWLFCSERRVPPEYERSPLSIAEAIKRQQEVEKIYGLLPKKQCGVCGSPDCRTFAEDVVDGKVSLDACPWHVESKHKVVIKHED